MFATFAVGSTTLKLEFRKLELNRELHSKIFQMILNVLCAR